MKRPQGLVKIWPRQPERLRVESEVYPRVLFGSMSRPRPQVLAKMIGWVGAPGPLDVLTHGSMAVAWLGGLLARARESPLARPGAVPTQRRRTPALRLARQPFQ